MNPAVKFGAIAVLALLAAIDHAGAACQSYRPDAVFIADLQKEDFHARVFPNAPQPPGPEEIQRLKVVRERRIDQLSDLAQLEGIWRLATGARLPYPIIRVAPFRWKLEPAGFPVADPVKIEFDGNGDGKSDVVQEAGKRPQTASYIYYREGSYEFTMTIRDRSGRVYTHQGGLQLLSPAAFDSRLQTVWQEFKEALRRGEGDAALECLHTQSRKRYKDALAAIPNLPARVDEALTTIRPVAERNGEGLYEMERRREDKTYSYQVRFEVDLDGAWRIRFF